MDSNLSSTVEAQKMRNSGNNATPRNQRTQIRFHGLSASQSRYGSRLPNPMSFISSTAFFARLDWAVLRLSKAGPEPAGASATFVPHAPQKFAPASAAPHLTQNKWSM